MKKPSVLLIILQIPFQLELIKTKEDVLIELTMLFISVSFGISLLYALNVKNKVKSEGFEIIIDFVIAFLITFIANYIMLFYHSTYPRFVIDFAISFFSYFIVSNLKSTGEKRIKNFINKVMGVDNESNIVK